MIVEVDQSIKVEQTNRDTAIAFSNRETSVLLIPAVVKRAAAKRLLELKNPNKVYLWLFVLALYSLLKPYSKRLMSIVIDVEYDGQEQNIKAILLQLFSEEEGVRPKIAFRSIGKKSRAHLLAISVVRGERTADRVLSLPEFLGPIQHHKRKRTGKR